MHGVPLHLLQERLGLHRLGHEHGAARDEPAIRSIAFPAISTGIYGFPKHLAADLAVDAMQDHEREFDRIVACLFDGESEQYYADARRGR